MARRIEHLTSSTWPAAEVFAALVDPEYLRDRLAAIGGARAELVSHQVTEGRTEYQLRQGVAAADLPSAARGFVGGDLVFERTEVWRAVSEDDHTGSVRVTIASVPGQLTGALRLVAAGEGSRLTLAGEVKVGIPLLGGKLEELVASQVSKLLDRESEFTAAWLAEHR